MFSPIFHRGRHESGFTIVELLVVIAIMGILAAIAIPSFIGAKRNGQDSRAQANLRAGLAGERTYYTDFQVYTQASAQLENIEPNLNWATSDATQEGVLAAVPTTTDQAVILASASQSGTRFCIMHIATTLGAAVNGRTAPGTYYASTSGGTSTTPAITACGTGYQTTDAAGW